MKIWITGVCAFFFLGLQIAFAQQSSQDVIYLKDGTAYWGTIIDEGVSSRVMIRLSGGNVVVVEGRDIDRIERKSLDKPKSTVKKKGTTSRQKKPAATKPPKSPREYAFQEKGLYHSTSIGALMGKDDNSNPVGLCIHHTTGYMFNRRLGAGLGIGFDHYATGGTESVFPVFAEVRGYLSKKKIAPFYTFSGGYGFALKRIKKDIEEAEGGWMFHPAFGLRIGADKRKNAFIDIGYRFQRARYTTLFPFSGDVQIKDYQYQRLTMRLGMVF
ncbi:MAG: hypothetical protein HUU34_19750 [Saprospiraceae bacterium]|nr:hypothetical protein [Saprospiraceae bacterium]